MAERPAPKRSQPARQGGAVAGSQGSRSHCAQVRRSWLAVGVGVGVGAFEISAPQAHRLLVRGEQALSAQGGQQAQRRLLGGQIAQRRLQQLRVDLALQQRVAADQQVPAARPGALVLQHLVLRQTQGDRGAQFPWGRAPRSQPWMAWRAYS
jgi:hypothetical protein